ncbi:MAG: hypothetical protein JKY30_04380 [Flavobacteriales bacterium]|nr:hypothetical protein [Flavobacteriales bacterium]
MRYLLAITSLFITISSFSQDAESLLSFVSTQEKDELEAINHTVLTYKHGNYKYGIKLLKKKMKKGVFYDGFLFLGYGEKQLGNNKKSIEFFNKAINLKPKTPIGYFIRGNTYLDMKYYRLALGDYKKCIKFDSLFYPAYNNLALIRLFNQGEAKPHKNDFKMAKEDLNFLLNCDENKNGIEEIYFNLGLVNLNLNQYYEATCFFTKAIGAEKIKNKAMYYNAVSKFNLKLYKEAEKEFRIVQLNNYRSEECEKYLSLIELIIKNK